MISPFYRGYMGLYGAVWGCMGLYGAILGYMGLYGAIGAIWGCMGLYGAIDYLESNRRAMMIRVIIVIRVIG